MYIHEDYIGNFRLALARAKALAASRGVSLGELVSEALTDKLRTAHGDNNEKPWMKSFGQLRHLHEETMRINQLIQQGFVRID